MTTTPADRADKPLWFDLPEPPMFYFGEPAAQAQPAPAEKPFSDPTPPPQGPEGRPVAAPAPDPVPDNSWGTLWLAMNPRCWERAHQVGLAIAVALGFLAGFLLGRAFIIGPHEGGYLGFSHTYSIRSPETYFLLLLLWTMGGATVAAALVYMVRLLRS